MAYTIVWTESATTDLEQLVTFIAADAVDAARELGLAIIERVEQLAAFPRSGRVAPEKGEDHLRELVFAPYRIVYEIAENESTVYVLRVWHSSRGAVEFS